MVFLLSEAEIYNTAYGFADTWSIYDEARRCDPTDYACAMGVQKEAEGSYEGNCFWWLRSPGGQAMFAVYVGGDGYVNQNGRIVDYASHAVRPALNLNLASPHSQAAGTVSSDGSVSELPPVQGPITITSISLDATVFFYDGMAKRPTVTVRSGDQIVSSSGYDVAYKDNVNAGTATVTVTGKDDYMGTLTATFAIKPAGLSSAKVSDVTNKTYNGMAQMQKPTVKVGSRTLKEGTDYTLSYKDNKKVGTATLTVTGKGNYTGSASKAFQIAKAANPMKVKGVKRAVKAAKVKQKVQVVARPIKFTKNARGEVTYKRVSARSSKSLTVNKKTGRVTVKKGTKKGTYKVKIQVAAKGTANYKKAAKTLTCTVVVM